MMEYKGYTARVEFDDDANVFRGEIVNLRDIITFEGESVDELRQALADAVDDYLAVCAERGEEPEKPFSGKLALRIEPALHGQVYLLARRANKSLNGWIAETLASAVSSD
jgi:predicted HicB family RNase H-like nuclease